MDREDVPPKFWAIDNAKTVSRNKIKITLFGELLRIKVN